MSTAAEQFCVDHAGIGYDVVRTQIQAIDFHDCYPVVDGDGRLTGKCIPGDTDGYSLCDIGYNGTPRLHEHASEALIADSGKVAIMADPENNAELFWQNMGEQFPQIARQLQSTIAEVDLNTWAQIQQITGFADGPSHAPHAIIEVAPSPPAGKQSFQTAEELQKYIDANGGSGLIVAVSSDGLSIAFGDENHSPTEAEFTPLRLLTEWDVDSVLSDREDTDF